jgi:hypothetical protein
MRDTLKFAAMLLVAALIWTVVNPVRIIVSVIVTMFPLVIVGIVLYLAFAGYNEFFVHKDEEEV